MDKSSLDNGIITTSQYAGQPEDIAHAVLYLMTNSATGTLHF